MLFPVLYIILCYDGADCSVVGNQTGAGVMEDRVGGQVRDRHIRA